MSKFRTRLGIGMVSAIPTPTPAQSTTLTSLGYANLGLPSELIIDDENDMNWPEPSLEGQSLDKEFTSYNYSKWTRIDQYLLSYWEVSLPLFSHVTGNLNTVCLECVESIDCEIRLIQGRSVSP